MQVRTESVTPESVQALSELLSRCEREAAPVIIRGGNTLRGMGRPGPDGAGTISTASFDRIVQIAAADLTVSVESGVRLHALEVALGKHGMLVPFDAPRTHDATVGGTLAAGWLGPRRHLYGRPRDYLLGTTCVLADGTVARAGGTVVKNVAGYDMSRLYVGSFGTLAVLVQANLKTLVAPAQTRVFLARLPDGTRARAMARVTDLDVAPAAAFFVDGFKNAVDGEDGAEGRLLVTLEGSAAVVDRATREVRSALGKAGVPETRIIDTGARESFERTVDAYVASIGERSITYRFSSEPSYAETSAYAVRSLAERFQLRSDLLVDVMNGDVIVRVSDLDAHALGAKIEMFDDAIHDLQPFAMIIAGEHPRRSGLAVWGADPDGIDRMRALKRRFDPKAILNRGRYVGGI